MKEILYKYNNGGLYQTEDDTFFAGDSHMKIIVESHEFSIAIGGDVLRSSSFDGCSAMVSREGEVVFYNDEDQIIGKAEKSEKYYEKVNLVWNQGFLSIQFGKIEDVDYYPNW